MSEIRNFALAAGAVAAGVVPAVGVGNALADAPTPSLDRTNYCLDQAEGVQTDAERGTFNPATQIGSGYVGDSLKDEYFTFAANAVSTDCGSIILSRTVDAWQIYNGRPNTRVAEFKGNGAFNTATDRKTRIAMQAFSCIPGPANRGYQVAAKETIKYRDANSGHLMTLPAEGVVNVRSQKTDGC